MKQLKKMSSFNIQVLEGVDPMSDANLAEIKGGGRDCECYMGTLILKPCECKLGTKVVTPIEPNSILKCEELHSLSFE